LRAVLYPKEKLRQYRHRFVTLGFINPIPASFQQLLNQNICTKLHLPLTAVGVLWLCWCSILDDREAMVERRWVENGWLVSSVGWRI